MTTAPDTVATEQVALPLDTLLTDAALGAGTRLTPNGAWTRFATGVAKRPWLLAGTGRKLGGELAQIVRGSSERAPQRGDNRFADRAWTENPLLKRTMQAYLAASEAAAEVLDGVELDWRDRERMKFVFENITAAASPSNNPLVNPVGYKALIDTAGLSAVRGLRNLLGDMARKPRIPSMVGSDAFTVGATIAATPGSVVYKSRVLELIQYAPRTSQVSTVPLLIVPPVINKFYVVDIAPGRSMVEHFLSQGQQVFAISWRNPKARHRDWGLDTYGQEIIDALGAIEKITGASSTSIYSACSGGMLATIVAAHLAASGQGDRIASLALAVTVLGDSKAGFAAAALDHGTARKAIKLSAAKGYLDGKELAEMFAWLRPTDLVWRYWVNNYIEGRQPAPFDVLYWNADTTRLAAALHKDMVTIGVTNALAVAGGTTFLGTPVDLSAITADVYVVAGIADHISPWESCYSSARMLPNAKARFILSSSGHIAALVNPPGNQRASYRAAAPDAESPEEWLTSATKHRDSWWPDYTAWLAERGGPKTDAPSALGSAELPPLMPSPGAYVREN
jgi:polyhydroxyalkanoate synthase